MYACIYKELLKNHNKFLCSEQQFTTNSNVQKCVRAHLANKADSDYDSDIKSILSLCNEKGHILQIFIHI